MNLAITKLDSLHTSITQIFSSLKLKDRTYPKGRKPILGNIATVSIFIFKQCQNIATKKSLFEIVEPNLSYNRFVVALNRVAKELAYIVVAVMNMLRAQAHPVKFTDATDLPVCMVKNAKYHRTMRNLATWSKTGKGWFYGLKLHLSADLSGKVLALRFTSGNSDDRNIFRKMNEKLRGIFVADAGYVSKELERDFHIERERWLITAVRANMKRLATDMGIALLNLRMRVEIHFRELKLFYGMVTSLPRSVDGYLAHYLASICAYLIA